MATTEEVIAEYLERLKYATLSNEEFNEIARRVRVMQSLIERK
jgi:hypothetical protein